MAGSGGEAKHAGEETKVAVALLVPQLVAWLTPQAQTRGAALCSRARPPQLQTQCAVSPRSVRLRPARVEGHGQGKVEQGGALQLTHKAFPPPPQLSCECQACRLFTSAACMHPPTAGFLEVEWSWHTLSDGGGQEAACKVCVTRIEEEPRIEGDGWSRQERGSAYIARCMQLMQVTRRRKPGTPTNRGNVGCCPSAHESHCSHGA